MHAICVAVVGELLNNFLHSLNEIFARAKVVFIVKFWVEIIAYDKR
jgi:hypothetical protein